MALTMGNLGAGLLSAIGYSNLMDDLTGIGNQAYSQAYGNADSIAKTAQQAAQFTPFTVTTGMGGRIGTDAQGNVDYSGALSAQEQALQNQAFQGAQTAFGNASGDLTGLQNTLYGQMRAMQSPEEQRQQLALENRLAAQGRLGVNTAQYGGTPEQLAMAKAQAEAQNQAAYMAMQQAQQYQQNQAQLGQSLMASGYAPQAQAMDMYGQGLQTAQLTDAARRQGAGYLADLGMAGLDAQLQSQLGRANLGANALNALATWMSTPVQGATASGKTSSSGSAPLGMLEGFLNTGVSDFFKGLFD